MAPTWHVLGVGAIGQLVAHQFRKQGARVVLLLRSEASLRSFKDAGESLTVQRLAPSTSQSAQEALTWQTEASRHIAHQLHCQQATLVHFTNTSSTPPDEEITPPIRPPQATIHMLLVATEAAVISRRRVPSRTFSLP